MLRKRIIFLASEKGGVGKSTVASNILCWAIARGEKAVAVDPDDANHTLVRLLQARPGEQRPVPLREDGKAVVVPVNVNASDSLDVVYHELVSGDNELVIVDGVGSQHSRTIMRWIEDVNFFEVADEINAEISFVLVLEEDADVYAQALKMMNQVGDKVAWVVVLNEKQHQVFPIWTESLARKKAQALDALEIRMAAMAPHIARGLHDLNVTLGVAEPAMPNMLDKQRVRTLWRNVTAELDKAAPYLLPVREESEPVAVEAGAGGGRKPKKGD